MTGLVEVLSWDSEFFGVPIGSVDLDGATPATLAAIDEEGRALGLSCIYGSLDPALGHTAYLVQEFGHRLVEVAITFSRPPGPFERPPTASVARRGTLDDLPMLQGAIDTLAPWSRFAADPRFGAEAARRMFEAWVKRAASEGDERMLAIAEDESGVTGISTHVRGTPTRIDLMGVTKPGTGASYALMEEFFDWAGDGTVEAGPCAARNVAVLRFLFHCKYNIARTQYLYHRWLDEGSWLDEGPATRN